MKREHPESSNGLPPMNGNFKMIEKESDAGVDELLAVLGYKVRNSDMADVALKLEQLDMVMGASTPFNDDGIISHLSSDTVHYNPSDLSMWLESMLSELNTPPPPLPSLNPNSISHVNPFDFQISNNNSNFITETTPILTPPFPAAYSNIRPDLTAPCRDRKRSRTLMTSSPPPQPTAISNIDSYSSSPHPVVVVDSQEAGIRLVHALMACAEAVQQENFKAADTLVKQITILSSSQGGAMRKVSNYFAEALARRIYGLHPQQDCSLESAFSDILQRHFYDSCPYLKFAHFTANQAILEAFEGCKKVHIIDFGMKQGMQWPALLQALAARPGGPPSFRLTGIGPPQPDNTDALQQVGLKLAELADSIQVDFEYRGFVASSLADLEPYILQWSSETVPESETEVVAVNSVFELHKLLAKEGAIEKVMSTIRAVQPKIVTVVEQEANHNPDSFTERFNEALHYYSTMFDSLEGPQDQVMTEVYLGRQICNVVACEGVERTERHEPLAQWKGRFGWAGFEPVHLGSNAFKQASMLLNLFAGGDGYKVEEKEGCLTLGWHTRPLIATSAWRVAV